MNHKIKVEFEVSNDFMRHLKRIQKEYNFKPCSFLDEVIYSYQVEDWNDVLSVTVDTSLQERPNCYITNKNFSDYNYNE